MSERSEEQERREQVRQWVKDCVRVTVEGVARGDDHDITDDVEDLFQGGRAEGLEQRLEETRAALGFIESAALFHPGQAWPDEMKAQLRRIGKLAHEALARLAPPPPRRGE